VHLIWAGLILGVAAVWGVPLVATILKSVLPAQAQAYIPTSTVPGVSAQAVVSALIYGLLLAGVLHVLRMVGLRGARA
jgi:hypothetical protein